MFVIAIVFDDDDDDDDDKINYVYIFYHQILNLFQRVSIRQLLPWIYTSAAGNNMFKVDNRNSRKRCEIC